MLVCIVLDRRAEKVLPALAWAALALAAVTDRARTLPRAVAALALLLTAMLVSVAAAWKSPHFGEAVYSFVHYQVGVVWLANAWLLAGVYFGGRQEGGPGLKALTAPLVLLALWCTASAAGSLFPKDSMKLLGAELLPYVGLFTVICRAGLATGAGAVRLIWARLSWAVIVAAALGMGVLAAVMLLAPQVNGWLLDHHLVRIDAEAPGSPRLQFLFYHHNRAGFFAACALFLALAGAVWGRWWRVAAIAGAAGAAVALPLTLTRGALAAAAVGLVLFILVGIFRQRRGRWIGLAAVVVAGPLLWLALPASYHQHVEKALDPASYQEGSGGSIGARLVMWKAAVGMIRERPWLGFGYGFENFEATAKLEHPELPGYFNDAPHAHNLWLETAAESGLPAAALLGIFTVLRLGMLAGAWVRAVRLGRPLAWLLALWLALEITIQIYGLTNYALRRNLGYLCYGIWAVSAVLALRLVGPARCFSEALAEVSSEVPPETPHRD